MSMCAIMHFLIITANIALHKHSLILLLCFLDVKRTVRIQSKNEQAH